MSSIPINVDHEAINRYIADKILESALGEHLEKAVDNALKSLNGYGADPLKTAVTAEIQKHIMEIVSVAYSDKIRENVRSRLTDEFLDSLVQSFVQSLTTRLDKY